MRYDAIIIPSVARPQDGQAAPIMRRLLDRALERWQDGTYFIPSTAYTHHHPVALDEAGLPLCEAVVMAHYLMERGVRREMILPEVVSQETIGNAFFTRVIHTEPRGLRKLFVIGADFHLPRVRVIFNWVFSLEPLGAPHYRLDYEAVSSRGIFKAEVLKARREKEKQRIKSLAGLKKRIRTLDSLHRFIYTEHDCYAVGRSAKRAIGPVAESY